MTKTIKIPADWQWHTCCWMAWAVHNEWGAQVDAVKQDLEQVITTVAEYELVRLLTPPECVAECRKRFAAHDIDIVSAPVDDIWARDILPTSAQRGTQRVWIDWNFNGWGGTVDRPRRPGDRLTDFISSTTGHAVFQMPFIAEGGAFITNGEGVVITTKSCLLNENRNPALGRPEKTRMQTIEQAMSGLGATKMIWLEGDADEPITCGHVDGYLMFSSLNALLVEGDQGYAPPFGRTRDIALLRQANDYFGRTLDVTIVAPPRARYGPRGKFSARSYLNAYLANGAVIATKFGDDTRDNAAKEALRKAFPTSDIRMLQMNAIVSGGGGIRCLTQPMI